MSKIRGFIGEQSFEVNEEDVRRITDRYCEAVVFSSIYRVSMKNKRLPAEARSHAHEAVRSFRRTLSADQ